MRTHVYLIPGFFGFANLGELKYFAHCKEPIERAYADARLDVDEATLAARREAMNAKFGAVWKPKDRQREVSLALRAYAALTTNASRGAVRDISQLDH